MIGAILPYMPEVDAREIASHSNLIVEADWETRRNYGESRIAKFGRWNGLVNASVWIVDGGSGSIARYGKDKCVQMMPLPCKHPFPCQHNVSTGASQVMLPYVKSVLDELDRMGARSMVVRSGKKKLLRALGKDVDPVFSDEMHEGNERLVLEYAVLASECSADADVTCCWRLSKRDGTFLKCGVWRGSDNESESQSVWMKKYESGGRGLVFMFGLYGAEIRFDLEPMIGVAITGLAPSSARNDGKGSSLRWNRSKSEHCR